MKKHEKVNKDKEKKSSSPLIIGIIIAVVLIVFASAIFIFNPSDGYSRSDYANYNHFAFEQTGNYWLTYVELQGVPYEAPFYNHPLDIQDVPYDESITEFVLGVGHVNFTIAVSDNVGATPVLAGANIARITGRLYGVPTSSALYAQPQDRSVNQTQYRYVDCSDATELSPIIWINPKDDAQGVYRDEANPSCIIVGATSDEEILESADVLAYRILQITP